MHKKKSDNSSKRRWLWVIAALVVLSGSFLFTAKNLLQYHFGLSPLPITSSSERKVGVPSTRESAELHEEFQKAPLPESEQQVVNPLPMENFRQVRFKIGFQLDLSLFQKAQMWNIWKDSNPISPEDLAERVKRSQEVLEEGQQVLLYEHIEQQVDARVAERLEKAKSVIPEDQYKLFEERIAERASEFHNAVKNYLENGQEESKTQTRDEGS